MKKEYRFTQRKGRAIQVMYDGDYKWISTGCYTMPEAESWARLHLRSHNKELTLREYAEGFYTKADPRQFRQRQIVHGHHYSELYYDRKQSYLDRWILPNHGAIKLSEITTRLIENLLFSMHLTNGSRMKVLVVYRDIMQSAKEDLYISSNPATEIKSFSTSDSKSRESFTPDEIARLFPKDDKELYKLWEGDFWPVYFMALHDTGWRPSEMHALHVNGIFPGKKAIYTAETISTIEREPQRRIKTSGYGYDFKIGFVSDRTMRMLQAHKNEDGYLFKVKGRFNYHQDINNILKRTCRKCGVRELSQYSFRHTFDSELFGAVPDEFRRMLMGHSGKSNYDYLHLKPEEAIERAEKLKSK